MFSVPVNTNLNVNDIKTQCGTTNPIWHYNPSSSLYESVTQVQPGYGYWLKVSNNCYIQVSGNNIESLPELKVGWNQVGALSQSVNFNDVKGNCNVLGGPWKYNPTTLLYESSTKLEPGYGYWIKVESNCRLIKKCPDETLSGICSPTKPKYCDNGNLVDRCNICNCPSGYGCQSDGSCMPSPPSTCDSTCKAQFFASGTCKDLSSTLATKLHIEGKDIKNDYGQTIYLRGFNILGHFHDAQSGYWEKWNYYNTTVVDKVLDKMKSYGVNYIREFTNVEYWINNSVVNSNIPNLKWRDMIKDFISRCRSKGIYVTLTDYTVKSGKYNDQDIGGYPPYCTSDECDLLPTKGDFINYITNRVVEFGQYDNYIADFWNEPYNFTSVDVKEWQSVWQQIINNVRARGYKGLILTQYSFGLGTWGNPDNTFRNLNWYYYYPLNDPLNNTIVSFHKYAGDVPTTYSELKTMYDTTFHVRDISLKIPVMAEEIGARLGSSTESEFLNNSLKIFNEWGLSYSIWSYSDDTSWSWSTLKTGTLFATGGDLNANGQISVDAIKTGGATSTCQSEETSIGQDGCSSGVCCCSGYVTPAQFQININPNSIIGKNNFSIGFMTDWSWPGFISDNARRQLVKDANFKLVRVFDFRTTSPKIMPCYSWDSIKNNCTSWDWTQVDLFTQKVFEIGAEPIFTLGWARDNIQNYMPSGMPINSTTGLPNLGSYAVYASEWVKHFKQKGWPVKYYEIMNEPFAYFGWNPSPSNNLKLTYFVDLWNVVARAMRQQNPNILLSQDALTQINVLDYWLQHGDNVDYLDFHKYDCGTWNKSESGYYSDEKLFGLAETSRFESTSSTYGVKESQQKWLTSRGKLLPVINSESNLNSAWEGGTDPRIQQMIGAVWKALELRKGILKGVSYSVYYEFSSNANDGQSRPAKGYGFGMINSVNNTPWYPYYVQKWIGKNLYVGDNLVQSTSSSNNIRTLTWINNGKLNIFLIHNSTKSETVSLQGVTGTFNYLNIDDPSGTSYLNPVEQTGTVNAGNSITLNGYTVMLLQQTSTVTTCSDGTAYSSCSVTKPKYCSSGTLIDKCSTCGCTSDQDCNITSQSCYSAINRNYILNYLNESFYRYLGSDVFSLTWVVDSYDILGVSPPDRNSLIKFFDSKQNQTDGTWFSRTNHYVPITAQVLMLYNRSGVKPAKSLDTFFSRIDTWDKVKTEVQTYDAGNYWGGIWGYVQAYVVYKGQAPPWTNEFLNEVNTKFDSWAYDSHQRTHLAMNLYALNLPMPRVDEVVLATLNDQGPDGNWSWSGSKWNLRETVFNIFMLGMIRYQTTVDKSLIDSAIARGTEYVKSCYNTTDVNGKTSGFFYPYLGSTYADPAATSLGTLTFLNPQSDVWTRWIVPSQKTTCTSCGTWTNGTCNIGGCTNQRQQTRTCTPTSCTPTDDLGLSRCVADSSCIVTGYDFAVIGDVNAIPELDNIYNMFDSLGITYKRLLPSEVVSGSLNDVNGAVSFVDSTGTIANASVINLFSKNHLVISHGYDFANFYYPSIKNYRSKTAVSTITYLSSAREFQVNDKTEFKRLDNTLEVFSNAGLNTIPNTVKIAQYNSTHTAIFQVSGLTSNSGFYVMDLKATRNQSNLNGIWNVFPAVEMVKSIPIGKYSSWIANGTNWPDLDWVNNHIKSLASSNSDIAKVVSIGKTVLGRDINAIFIGKGSRHAIIDGCIHGNEKSGAFSAIRTAELLLEYYRSDPSWQEKLNQYNITIIPVLNPDGFAANNRTNANGKDLNRQFPPGGTTTEPETLALRNLFDKDKPIIYINHHEGGCQYPFTALYGNYLVEPYTNFTLYTLKEANRFFTSLGHWGYINCSSEGKGNVKVNTFYAIGRGGINSMAIAYASKYINTSSEILETFASGAKNSLWALEAYPNLDINHLEHYDNDGNFLFYSNGFISSTNMQGTALDVTLDTDELTTSSTTRIRDMKNRGKPTEVYLDGVKKSEGGGWSYSSTTLITTVTGAKDSIRLVWIT